MNGSTAFGCWGTARMCGAGEQPRHGAEVAPEAEVEGAVAAVIWSEDTREGRLGEKCLKSAQRRSPPDAGLTYTGWASCLTAARAAVFQRSRAVRRSCGKAA